MLGKCKKCKQQVGLFNLTNGVCTSCVVENAGIEKNQPLEIKKKSYIKNIDSFSRLTSWVKYFIYIQIVIAVISIVSGIMEYQLLSDFVNGAYVSQADADSSDQRQKIIAISYTVIYILSGILILRWIFISNHNVRQLGAKDMKFSPGWAVGWYFIPIFWLWKPYQAMKEIWKASRNPESWKYAEVSATLPWWWFFWLINAFLGQQALRMSLRAQNTEQISVLMNLNIMYQSTHVASILLAVTTLILINNIFNNQKNYVQKIKSINTDRENITDNPSKQTVEENQNNIYDLVWTEIENNNIKTSLWSRSYAECEGDENKTKAKYIQLRVDELSKKGTDSDNEKPNE